MLRHLGRYLRTAARVSRTRYPGFILGLPLGGDDIPVFTYHDLTSQELRRDLEFLAVNGYRTLSLDEYLHAREQRRARTAGTPSNRRRVLLSFDDARKSFWQTALPLLREFDAHAVLFAPTYWMDPPAQRGLEARGEPGNDLFMTWPQLRACVASGHVDVQSHAHRHALVAVSASRVDFANPRALARFDVYDWPMRRLGERDELGRPAPGTPVYRSMPLLSAPRRYLESGEAMRACQERVERGGEDFFTRPGWRAELKSVHDRHARARPGRFMSPVAFQHLLASEFERSRAAFETQLGYAPSCIAYPWMLGSRASLELACRFGLRAAFGVALDYRAERDRTLPLPVYGRLKCDWLRFMPGVRRHGALAAVRKKLGGLAGIQHLAH